MLYKDAKNSSLWPRTFKTGVVLFLKHILKASVLKFYTATKLNNNCLCLRQLRRLRLMETQLHIQGHISYVKLR